MGGSVSYWLEDTVIQVAYDTARGSRSASPIGAMGRSVSRGAQGSRVVSCSVEGRGRSVPGRLPRDRVGSSDRGRAQLVHRYTPGPGITPSRSLQDPAIVGGWISQGMPVGNRAFTTPNPHPLAAAEQRLPPVSSRSRQYPTSVGRTPIVRFEDPWEGEGFSQNYQGVTPVSDRRSSTPRPHPDPRQVDVQGPWGVDPYPS